MALNRIGTTLGIVLVTAFVSACGEGSDDTAGGDAGAAGSVRAGAGGSNSSGAGGGSGGLGGKTATGGNQSTQGWNFDAGTEEYKSWGAFYSNPATLMAEAELTHDTTEGDPAPGALRIVIPFGATQAGGPEGNQKIHVGINTTGDTPLDLTGKTVTARFRLLEGLTSDPTYPGGAKLYVKSGADFVWADGGWTNIESLNWMTLSISPSTPLYKAAGFDPADIVEIGIEIATNGGVAATMGFEEATVLIDSVRY